MSKEYRHQVDPGLGSVSAVVSSLPAGYTLGEARVESEIKYRLFFNAGGEQIGDGFCFSPVPVGGGPYSVTITTVSDAFNNIGAGMVYNATATTDTYFWGAVRGHVGAMVGDDQSVPTGKAFAIGSDGKIELATNTAGTAVVIAPAVGVNLGGAATKTVTTGASSGDCFVMFE